MRSVLVVYAHRARAEALGVAIDGQPDLVWAGALQQSEQVPPTTTGDPPDVVVIEGGSGGRLMQTIRSLRAALPGAHIVVLTDAPDPTALADAAEAGAAAFVSDRDSLSHLLGAVRAADSGLLLVPTGTFTELVRVVTHAPRVSTHHDLDEQAGHARQPLLTGSVAEVIDLRSGDPASRTVLTGADVVDDGSRPGDRDRRASAELEQAYRRSGLTPRERDVLVLLGQGLDAQGIARELFMSVHTARGHLKSIMLKLGVHSQLEAVVTAARMGLLPDFPEPASAR
jgi:DNA-binding NarL/FixJ family response regulator